MAAAVAMAGLAAQFITEPESYPVFLAWLAKASPSVAAQQRSRAEARDLADGFLLLSVHMVKVIDGSDPG
jgi:hypothetical protein